MLSARLKRVLDYIGAKLDEDLSLLALANVAGMNLCYFARLFKQSTGLNPHRYVLEQRITRAKQLLRAQGMTVFEAGVRTGFADQGHFTKVFRRFVGVTPTKFRSSKSIDCHKLERYFGPSPSCRACVFGGSRMVGPTGSWDFCILLQRSTARFTVSQSSWYTYVHGGEKWARAGRESRLQDDIACPSPSGKR